MRLVTDNERPQTPREGNEVLDQIQRSIRILKWMLLVQIITSIACITIVLTQFGFGLTWGWKW